MSRRYSRCRSTAEEVLCTAKLGLTKARVPPVLRGVFFQLEAVPLPVPTTLSECLPVLLTRAVAEAAFCSLGDWLKVCRTPRGAVAEPRDSWLEACSEDPLFQTRASPERNANLRRGFMTCFSVGCGAAGSALMLAVPTPCCSRRCSISCSCCRAFTKAAFRRLVCSTLSAFFWLDVMQFSHITAPPFSRQRHVKSVLHCTHM